MIIPSRELCIIPLEKGHNLSLFSSSNEDLNDFLHNDAIKSQEDLISRTYLCIWQSRIAGFFTLVTDTIEVKLVEQEDGIDDYNYQKYPAIKIARMAVDEKLSGCRCGKIPAPGSSRQSAPPLFGSGMQVYYRGLKERGSRLL